MASLSNINGLFDVHSTGAILFSTSHGLTGQILRSNGDAAPTWVAASTVIGGPYLPLTGGTLTGATATDTGISFTVGGNLFVTGTSTLTGALSGTSATFAGGITMSDSILISYTGSDASGRDAGIKIVNDNNDWGMIIDKGNGAANNYGFRINTDGAFAFGIWNSGGTNKIRFSGAGDAVFEGNVTAPSVASTDTSGRYFMIQNAAGNQTYPVYSFRTDGNTGMMNPGADILSLVTGGTTRLTINNSSSTFAGNVTAPTFVGALTGTASQSKKINGISRTAITVGGNANTYYPVALTTGAGSTYMQYSEFVIERGGYDDPGYTGIGFSTLNARFSYKPSGWGYGAVNSSLEMMGQTAQMVASYQDYYHASQMIIWLRGATRYYIWPVVGSTAVVFENTGGTDYVGTYTTFTPTTVVSAIASYTRNFYGSLRTDSNFASGGNITSGGGITSGGNVLVGTAVSNNYPLEIEANSGGGQIYLKRSAAYAEIFMGGALAVDTAFFIRSAGTGGVKLLASATSWASASDISIKENIKPLENALEKIKDYRCIEYTLKESPENKKIGFIAQDWKEDYPQIVDKDEDGLLSMKYTETIPVLLKAIQELEARVKELENK